MHVSIKITKIRQFEDKPGFENYIRLRMTKEHLQDRRSVRVCTIRGPLRRVCAAA